MPAAPLADIAFREVPFEQSDIFRIIKAGEIMGDPVWIKHMLAACAFWRELHDQLEFQREPRGSSNLPQNVRIDVSGGVNHLRARQAAEARNTIKEKLDRLERTVPRDVSGNILRFMVLKGAPLKLAAELYIKDSNPSRAVNQAKLRMAAALSAITVVAVSIRNEKRERPLTEIREASIVCSR